MPPPASEKAPADAPRAPEQDGESKPDQKKSERPTTFRTFSYRAAGTAELGAHLERPDASGSDPEPESDETTRPFAGRGHDRARSTSRIRPVAGVFVRKLCTTRVRCGHGALPPPASPLF